MMLIEREQGLEKRLKTRLTEEEVKALHDKKMLVRNAKVSVVNGYPKSLYLRMLSLPSAAHIKAEEDALQIEILYLQEIIHVYEDRARQNILKMLDAGSFGSSRNRYHDHEDRRDDEEEGPTVSSSSQTSMQLGRSTLV